MHRATPRLSSFRAYVAGGSRALIDKIDDGKFMQEMAGGMMKAEYRDKIEAPQNYGFTSVVQAATKGADGMIDQCAEGFMMFLGGSRSLPVCGVMDDRRHRMWGAEEGDVGMYRLASDLMQLHLTKDGGFWSALTKSKLRLQLVDKDQQDGQQQGGASPSAHDVSGSATTGDGAGGQQSSKQMGQKPVYKKGVQNSKKYHDLNGDMTQQVNKEHQILQDDMDTAMQVVGGNVYLGGLVGKHQFCRVVTTCGPAKNVWARMD